MPNREYFGPSPRRRQPSRVRGEICKNSAASGVRITGATCEKSDMKKLQTGRLTTRLEVKVSSRFYYRAAMRCRALTRFTGALPRTRFSSQPPVVFRCLRSRGATPPAISHWTNGYLRVLDFVRLKRTTSRNSLFDALTTILAYAPIPCNSFCILFSTHLLRSYPYINYAMEYGKNSSKNPPPTGRTFD